MNTVRHPQVKGLEGRLRRHCALGGVSEAARRYLAHVEKARPFKITCLYVYARAVLDSPSGGGQRLRGVISKDTLRPST